MFAVRHAGESQSREATGQVHLDHAASLNIGLCTHRPDCAANLRISMSMWVCRTHTTRYVNSIRTDTRQTFRRFRLLDCLRRRSAAMCLAQRQRGRVPVSIRVAGRIDIEKGGS